jgi:dual specificity protein kinase YAK1
LKTAAAMDQWQPYSDSAGAGGSRRYNNGASGNNSSSSSQMAARDYNNGAVHAQPPVGYKYDQYPSASLGVQQQQNPAASPVATPQLRDGNGDVAMQDVQDPYASVKYPMRPHHQQHLSGGRSLALHSPQEPSAAAQRYSPMEVLSPTSPYAPKSAGASQLAQSPAQRQSPTRSSDYPPPQSTYYNNRQPAPQLPSINPYAPAGQDSYSSSSAVTPMDGTFANDPKSPRRMPPQPVPSINNGPVPEFKEIRSMGDLRPKVNSQPLFRRANPEGGFISVRTISRIRNAAAPLDAA